MQDSARFYATLVYALQAASVVLGLPFFIAVLVNYWKRSDVVGTLYESHFRWQIRTFWFSVLWTIVGTLTIWLLVGYAILFLLWLWIIYRIVRGWLALYNHQPMYRF